jgi:hypothetical protein
MREARKTCGLDGRQSWRGNLRSILIVAAIAPQSFTYLLLNKFQARRTLVA